MGLNYEIRNIINDMSEAVQQKFDITIPILNIDDVVYKMGGIITEDASLDSFADGQIRKYGSNGFEIVVSRHQPTTRRKFTIAHELGHLFLHMGFLTNQSIWESQNDKVFYRNGNSDLEYQANEFAAAFLMPKSEYKKIMDQNTNGRTVYTSEIARHFGVSVDTASNRGKWLGLLEW